MPLSSSTSLTSLPKMMALTPYGSNGSTDLTMAVLGCGTMGVAILSGILTSLSEMQGPKPLQQPRSGASTPMEEVPQRLPSRFIACVNTAAGAKRVKGTLWEHSSVLKVVHNENLAAVQQAEVVLLSCKAGSVKEILSEHGIAKALHGKLLISVAAGVTVEDIEIALHGAVPSKDPAEDGRCRIVRAMCNTAAVIRESMTVVATTNPPLDPATEGLVTWIFKRIGEVAYLPAANMDASTALCASGPAFFALVLEAAIDGAVAMGIPRVDAQRMAVQTMRGMTGLVQNGEHPALLREKNCTSGGCTIGGVLVLEEGRVRGTVARAVREAAVVASQLGKGAEQVNGTRFGNSGFQ
ncbi:pyrroline-5-carboxylate reductase dimerization-domain-containing protein [Dactylonectria estremocensis]|uniref:Pyrroline-5-carboxylate reductase dimerization-domain-containing protein n=1 Tax=Dactylonectria estremocensis TaxID=1079267 RepID=A0A9P9JI96_9HYPO|nr:pyrroline-5-carboxylate reductase dimerization-domain-containing protein [Dactylonectria estremocensis]